jgi:hypothetical protein
MCIVISTHRSNPSAYEVKHSCKHTKIEVNLIQSDCKLLQEINQFVVRRVFEYVVHTNHQ